MKVRGVEERTNGLRDLRLIQGGGMGGPGVHGTTVADHHSASPAEMEIDRGVLAGFMDGHRVESLKTGAEDRARGGVDLRPRVDCGPRGHADSGRVASSAMMHLEANGSTQSFSRWTQGVDLGWMRTLFMEEGVTRSERRRMGRGDPTRRFKKELE